MQRQRRARLGNRQTPPACRVAALRNQGQARRAPLLTANTHDSVRGSGSRAMRDPRSRAIRDPRLSAVRDPRRLQRAAPTRLWPQRGTQRSCPALISGFDSALAVMISWMTTRGSAEGSAADAIDHKVWPGRTTICRMPW